jgi:hypothetical protein
MCDGIIHQKLWFISELMRLEQPGKRQEYLQEHLTWTVEELREYFTWLAPLAPAENT